MSIKIIDSKYFLSTVVVIACFVMPLSINAQEYTTKAPLQAEEEISKPEQAETLENDIEYVRPTAANVNKLFWHYDIFSKDNESELDTYLLLNECDLYRLYKKDDFEWDKLTASIAESMDKASKNFPTNFEFGQQIQLQDYEISTGKFRIQEKYHIEETNNFVIPASDAGMQTCLKTTVASVPHFVRELVFKTNRPFGLKEFDVDKDVAKAYLEKKQSEYVETTRFNRARADRDAYYLRDAYLFVRIKIFKYGGFISLVNKLKNDHTFYAILDGYDVYADPRKEMLISSINLRQPAEIGPMEMRLRQEYSNVKGLNN